MKNTDPRKKTNYMINTRILMQFNALVPPRKRSDAVNEALEEWMIQRGRELASKAIDEFRIKNKLKMSDAEIRKAINYGRE
ncbi:hypothetical protein COV82_01370 [Candidatus Peregrinibacteria bacterium CG11_big_fil_rev_8_21_14_0_20_46_8]|nr:MAG: hypothetical protein COV82_01370 [Candidatus Peregrinibacteria bacterium CG11_big_fil_rev_8_21_14_0_20_46_8]